MRMCKNTITLIVLNQNQVFPHYILCGLLPKMSSFGVTEFNLAIEYALRVLGKEEELTLKQA